MARAVNRSWRTTTNLILLLLCGLLSGMNVPGQTSKHPSRRDNKQDEREKIIRQSAVSSLDAVIDELPQLESLNDRLSIADGIVRLLAKSKPDRCRKLLDSLFDHAREARRNHSTDDQVNPNPDVIVERIIQLAALFDTKLAEKYADRYSSDSNDSSEQSSGSNAAQNASLRLKLALQLVESAPATSVAIAESSINAGVFPETLAFLGSLRRKDIRLASRFFSAALSSIQRRGGFDVNELFLLYAYVFSPQRVPVATSRGIGVFSIPEYNAAAENYPVDMVLARLYLDGAARLVLDQNRLNPQTLPLLKNGIEGDYYFIAVILPAITNYFPEFGASLGTRRSVLAAMLQQDRREFSQNAADHWDNTPISVNLIGGANAQTVDYLLERAEKTADQARRDRLYYQAATKASLSKDYERAIKIVDKLSGPNSVEAKQFIIFDVALNAARHRELELAEFYARRDDDLTRRAFVFTTIAASLVEGATPDSTRAREFLEETVEMAAKLNKEEERAVVLFGLAAVYSRFDLTLASQVLTIAIQSANKVEYFGRDTRIRRGFNIGGFLFDYSLYGNEFTFTKAFKMIGSQDFDGTLLQVKMLKNRFPRLAAIVIVCEGVLGKSTKV